MEKFPDISLDHVNLQVQPYNKDLGTPMKKSCETLRSFLKEFFAQHSQQGDPEVSYLDQDEDKFMRLESNTEEEDLVIKTKRGKRKAELRIIYTKAPKTFDESAFFKDAVSMRSIHKRENEVEFYQLRVPQEESLKKMRHTMRYTSVSQFLVVMPTGVGKTAVMALAPFALNVNDKVLILSPTVWLKEQIAKDITTMYNKKQRDNAKAHPIGRTGDVDAEVWEYDGRDRGLDRSDIIVANVQQFAMDKDTLRPNAIRLIKDLKIDLVIVDEGHHSAAKSWQLVQSAIVDRNPLAKFLFVTATPLRTDGIHYGITDESQLYLCKRRFAQTHKYIKNTHCHPIELSDDLKKMSETMRKDKKRLYSNPNYIKAIIDPAIRELLDLRETCRDAPLRMLVFARTNENGKDLAAHINRLCEENKWRLHAEEVRGSQREDTRSVHNRFSCSREYYENVLRSQDNNEPFVDIVVQVKLFGEGYDNPWIAVTTFVAPQLSLNVVAQGHGRALRAPPREMSDINSPRKWEAHLFYPKIDNHDDIVQDYLNGADESAASIVSPFYRTGQDNQLTIAHRLYLKKEREEGIEAVIEEMKITATHYHNVYRERRQKWTEIPAETLAEKIFRERIATQSADATTAVPFTFKLIDFGCGEDLLFEKKLCEMASTHDGTGHIAVLAVDVKEYFDDSMHSGDGIGTQGQLTFSHKGLACNYYELEKQESFTNWCQEQKADAAVFCLSLMLKDSVPDGLIAAMNVVKPGGPIYIVLDATKFGLYVKLNRQVKEKALAMWKDMFIDACGGLLQVVGKLTEKTDGMVYVELKNVSTESDKQTLIKKLRKTPCTTLNSLKIRQDAIDAIREEFSRKRHNSAQQNGNN